MNPALLNWAQASRRKTRARLSSARLKAAPFDSIHSNLPFAEVVTCVSLFFSAWSCCGKRFHHWLLYHRSFYFRPVKMNRTKNKNKRTNKNSLFFKMRRTGPPSFFASGRLSDPPPKPSAKLALDRWIDPRCGPRRAAAGARGSARRSPPKANPPSPFGCWGHKKSQKQQTCFFFSFLFFIYISTWTLDPGAKNPEPCFKN